MRIKKPEVVFKSVRLLLNRHSDEIIEQVLAKALTGDSLALLAASYLMMEANKAMATAIEERELSDGEKWLKSLVSADCSLEEMAAFKATWNRLKAANSDQVAADGKQ